MVDKRACQGLRIDQGRSTELRATNKNSQRTKIVLNNPAERMVVAIRLETSDREADFFLGRALSFWSRFYTMGTIVLDVVVSRVLNLSSDNSYEAVACPACTKLHFIDRKTRKLLGEEKLGGLPRRGARQPVRGGSIQPAASSAVTHLPLNHAGKSGLSRPRVRVLPTRWQAWTSPHDRPG